MIFIFSWFNLSNSYASNNLSISSRFPSLLGVSKHSLIIFWVFIGIYLYFLFLCQFLLTQFISLFFLIWLRVCQSHFFFQITNSLFHYLLYPSFSLHFINFSSDLYYFYWNSTLEFVFLFQKWYKWYSGTWKCTIWLFIRFKWVMFSFSFD
jgi:hypothetical protein